MNKLKVATRLALGFGCVCILLVITVAIGITKVSALNAGTIYIVQNKLPKIEMAHTLLENVDTIAIALRNMMLDADEADRKRQLQVIVDARKRVDTIMEQLDSVIVTAEGKALQVKTKEARAKYFDGQNQLLALVQGGKDAEAKAYLVDSLRPVLLAYKDLLVALVAHETAAVDVTAKAAQQTYVDSRNQMLGLGVLAIAMATLVGWWITRGLLKQLGGEPDYAADIAAQIAAGNLSVNVAVGANDRSSLIFAMESMRAQLAGVVRDVRASTDLITTASGEIAAGNQELSVRT
ncbi:MAG TPA: MCP four helix bundle domain-containing protein, partial [Telluria sp.]|nr:MCP four helix bundle domain-containing protein [Telluria sp.]